MTDTLEQQEITIFYNKEVEASYLQWLNRLNNAVGKLYEAYNLFAEKIGAGPFDKTTLKSLISNNPQVWATSIIDEVVNKFDVPLRPAYLEYYWGEFNKIKGLLHDVEFMFSDNVNQVWNKIPGELLHINNLPEIVNGELEITEEFLNNTKKYFEIKVNTGSRAYELLNQIKTVYEELTELVNKKKGKIYNYTAVWDTSSQYLAEMKFFLTRRSDGTLTICDQTLNQLLK